jgi:hypothetical protein
LCAPMMMGRHCVMVLLCSNSTIRVHSNSRLSMGLSAFHHLLQCSSGQDTSNNVFKSASAKSSWKLRPS